MPSPAAPANRPLLSPRVRSPTDASGRALGVVLVVVALLAGAVLLVARSGFLGDALDWRWPDRHNPWAPLRVEETPGWLTRWKLARLDAQPAACRAVLAGTALQVEPVADTPPGRASAAGCVIRHAVRVRATQLRVGEPFTLSCRAAVSLALWERHAVLPAAERVFGIPVQRLEHFGSVACRNVGGREDAPRSRHASADALDVGGFVLADGQRITVARDWRGDGAKARFLHAVHRGACRYFDGVLGPDYDRAHADHFHLDRGPSRVCR